jgi:hypothetical protein
LSIPVPQASVFGIRDPAQLRWVQQRLTPHPLKTYISPLKISNKVGNGLSASYIICTDPPYEPLEGTRNWIKSAGWKTTEIKAGHDAMVVAPEGVADLLDRRV